MECGYAVSPAKIKDLLQWHRALWARGADRGALRANRLAIMVEVRKLRLGRAKMARVAA